jgi:hypothetical protein
MRVTAKCVPTLGIKVPETHVARVDLARGDPFRLGKRR